MILDLLPPRVSNPRLFALFADILAVRVAEGNAELRLRLIESKLPWEALAHVADGHGVLSPFVWALMRRSLLLPVPAGTARDGTAQHPTTQLTAIYQQHLSRRQCQCNQLVSILGALNRESIEPLLLKGARYVLAPAGVWSEARDMRDIDLLVRPGDAERTIAALAAQGYTPDPRPIPMDQHLPEMWHDGHPSAVEVHTEALSFSARKILTTEEIWRYATRLSTDHSAFYVLPAEWHLLHGLLNHQISDRCYDQRMLAVKSLWEFAKLADEVSDQGWKSIVDRMTASRHADVLGSCLVQAMRLFGITCPQGIEISPAARAHAEATFENAAAPDWLRHCRRLSDQLRFGFARETLAVRYRLDENKVSIWTMGRHLRFLTRHYRGRMLYRLFGQRGRPS